MSRDVYLYWEGIGPAGVVRDWPELCTWLRQTDSDLLEELTHDVPQEPRALEIELVRAFLAYDAVVPEGARELLLAVLARPEGARSLCTGPDEAHEDDEWDDPPTIPARAAQVTEEQWQSWSAERRRRAALLLELSEALASDPEDDEDDGEERRHRLLACLELLPPA